MSTKGGVQYTGGCPYKFSGFINDVPHINHGILVHSPLVLNTPNVLKISSCSAYVIPCTEHLPVYCTDIMQGGQLVFILKVSLISAFQRKLY